MGHVPGTLMSSRVARPLEREGLSPLQGPRGAIHLAMTPDPAADNHAVAIRSLPLCRPTHGLPRRGGTLSSCLICLRRSRSRTTMATPRIRPTRTRTHGPAHAGRLIGGLAWANGQQTMANHLGARIRARYSGSRTRRTNTTMNMSSVPTPLSQNVVVAQISS